MSNYKHHFLFGKKNFTIVLIGIGIMLLGFVLMIGGGSAPDLTQTYPEDTLYGFQRTILAPFLVLVGLGTQLFAIFTKPSADDVEKIQQEQSEVDAVKKRRSNRRKKQTA